MIMKRRKSEKARDRITRGLCSKLYNSAKIIDHRERKIENQVPFRMAYINESGERIEREFYGSPDEILDELTGRKSKLLFMEVQNV